ncbi:MAG: hypothetical protein U0893_13065 [Chloroflexota bacterium]
MSQINVNSPTPVDDGERATSAGFGMIAVILAIIVAVVVVWLLFAGLFSGPSSSTTSVNVSPPAQSQPAQKDSPSVNINVPKVEVNPPAQQPAAPAKP